MIEISCDAAAVTATLSQASAQVGVRLAKRMLPIGSRLHQLVVRGKLSGDPLHKRTGTLQRSVQSAANNNQATTVTPDRVETRIWFDPAKAPYGAMLEYGGTILPKRSRFLAIPLGAMKTAAGVSRGTAREVMANPTAFGFKHAFVAKGVIFGYQGHGKRGMVTTVPLFALKSRVVIPEFAPLRKTLADSREWIAQEVAAATGEVVQWFGGQP